MTNLKYRVWKICFETDDSFLGTFETKEQACQEIAKHLIYDDMYLDAWADEYSSREIAISELLKHREQVTDIVMKQDFVNNLLNFDASSYMDDAYYYCYIITEC